MPITRDELRAQLSDIEPDEGTYKGIGASEVDALRQLLDDEEPWLAARAVYALSRINAEPARLALIDASRNARPEVRVAVAASAGSLPPEVSDDVLSTLLNDPELGVRKFAVRSSSARNSVAIRRRVKDLATSETDAAVRRIAIGKARAL
jgi:hypothetical protein